MARLHFQKDGLIRVAAAGEADQILSAESDPSLLAHLRSPVTIEAGLTAQVLMRALRPWTDQMSEMGWLDFSAWDRALSRAHLREVGKSLEFGKEEPEISEIVLKARVDLRDGVSGAVRMTESWDLRARYRPDDPRRPEGEEFCSIRGAFVAEWATLPLVIEPQAQIWDFRRNADDLLERIELEPTFYDAIVLGFLDDMSADGLPDEAEAIARGDLAVIDQIAIGRSLDD